MRSIIVFTVSLIIIALGCSANSSISAAQPLQPDYQEIRLLRDEALDCVEDAQWSPDGSRIAAIGCGKLGVWDAESGDLLLLIDSSGANMLAWSPDGTLLAGGGGPEGWSVELPMGDYEGVALRLWDSRSGEMVVQFAVQFRGVDFPLVSAIAWNPSEPFLAAVRRDGAIHIWDTQTMTELPGQRPPFVILSNYYTINSIAWRPDGRQLAIGDSGGIGIFEVTDDGLDPRTVDRLAVTEADISNDEANGAIVWSPDGSHIAGIGTDYLGKIWDVSTGQVIITFGSRDIWMTSIDWNPNGALIATSGRMDGRFGPGIVSIWDADTGMELAAFSIAEANSVSWSPNGTQLAVGAGDGVIRILQAAT